MTADAVVIGSGPNGLVAAITLARAGWDVVVLEQADVPGGAIRTEELTKPGYKHDTFSAFYGLLHASPVFRELDLASRLQWAHFGTPVAAVSRPGEAGFIHLDREQTAAGLGEDGGAWNELSSWWDHVGIRFFEQMLGPVIAPRALMRFVRAAGIKGAIDTAKMMLAPIASVASERFATERARLLLASGVSHTDLGVDTTASTPTTLFLAMLAQTVGMPVPVGGAGALARALASLLEENSGVIRTGETATRVIVERGRARAVETSRGDVVRARHAILADTGAPALFRDIVTTEKLPSRFLDGLRRFRYGTGIFKLDLALDGPAPWFMDELKQTGVVHLTGTLEQMARAGYEARNGLLPTQPMLIVGQQSVADRSRAPGDGHTLWIETHVPPHPRGDGASDASLTGWPAAREPFTERVLDLLERHAPGVRARIVGQAVHAPDDFFARNPNLVGGDAGGGSAAADMQLIFRPVPGWFRYRTPVKGLYLCSASTHPGGGVHGMCGRNCARRVIKDSRRPRGIAATATGARRTPG